MSLLPVGLAVAGPLSAAIGPSALLLIGAAVVVSTSAAALSRWDVRHFRDRPLPAVPAVVS